MVEPPPRDPPDPADDETVIVPPGEPVDETIVREEWGPETVVTQPVDDDAVVVEETEPRRKPPTLWPWLLALLVLVLVGLGAFYLLSRDDDEPSATTNAATTQAEERTVPDVVGTTSSEATATLRDAGFEANLVSVPSDRPPGTVVAQNPAPGTTQPEGTRVRLNVAEEATGNHHRRDDDHRARRLLPTTTAPPPQPSPAVVPDVVGDELADAARAFADEGLKASVAYVPSQEPAGRVVAQAQAVGTELERGGTVQINVSTGPDPAAGVAVPNVTGRTLDEARQALEAAGFEVLALSPNGGAVKNSSQVASQTPGGGASIPGGSLVIVYVRG